jgi:hypothetical protein
VGPTCIAHQGADVSGTGAPQPQLSVHKVFLPAPGNNTKVAHITSQITVCWCASSLGRVLSFKSLHCCCNWVHRRSARVDHTLLACNIACALVLCDVATAAETARLYHTCSSCTVPGAAWFHSCLVAIAPVGQKHPLPAGTLLWACCNTSPEQLHLLLLACHM